MKSNINVEEKRTDFLNMWKNFWNPEQAEITEEEMILKDNEISEEDKKELLRALKITDKLSNSLFKDSYKTARLEEDTNKSIKASLKQKGTSRKLEQKNAEKSEEEIKQIDER